MRIASTFLRDERELVVAFARDAPNIPTASGGQLGFAVGTQEAKIRWPVVEWIPVDMVKDGF